MTGAMTILLLSLLMCLVLVIAALRHEARMRKTYETATHNLQKELETAQARLDAITKMQSIQKEARHEADKKIDEVRSTGGTVRFNSIMDELFHIESPDSD